MWKHFLSLKRKIPLGQLFLLYEMSNDRLESCFLYSSELSSQSQVFKRNPLILPWDFSAKRQEGRGKEGNARTMMCGTGNYLLITGCYQSSCNKAWYHWGKHSVSQDVEHDYIKVSPNFSSLWQCIKVLITQVSLAASADLFLLVTG